MCSLRCRGTVDVHLGVDSVIDPGVLLGYPSGRPGRRRRDAHRAGRQDSRGIDRLRRGRHRRGLRDRPPRRHPRRDPHRQPLHGVEQLDDRLRLRHRRSRADSLQRLHRAVHDHRGRRVFAPGVTIANDPHPVCTKCMQGPTIRKGARIGVNVTLLPLITIGENALVGAGSVVTADVPGRHARRRQSGARRRPGRFASSARSAS